MDYAKIFEEARKRHREYKRVNCHGIKEVHDNMVDIHDTLEYWVGLVAYEQGYKHGFDDGVDFSKPKVNNDWGRL